MFPKYLDDKLLVTVPLPITKLLTKYFDEVVMIHETNGYDDIQRKALKLTDFTEHASLVRAEWHKYAE